MHRRVRVLGVVTIADWAARFQRPAAAGDVATRNSPSPYGQGALPGIALARDGAGPRVRRSRASRPYRRCPDSTRPGLVPGAAHQGRLVEFDAESGPRGHLGPAGHQGERLVLHLGPARQMQLVGEFQDTEIRDRRGELIEAAVEIGLGCGARPGCGAPPPGPRSSSAP